MKYKYEIIRAEEGLPIKAFIHGIEGIGVHWHDEIEILLVLEGTVNIRIGEEVGILKENQFILINSREPHNTWRTKDENVLLAIQIDSNFYGNYYPEFDNIRFNYKSFLYGEDGQEKFDIVRYYIAKIAWELNKKNQGYELIIVSYLYLLGAYLINNFEYTVMGEENEEVKKEDILRLQRIVDYVNKNYNRKITLKEIAKMEHMSYYYMSHFIKEKMGVSFQEYINSIRLNNATKMLVTTDSKIIDISNLNGFSNINSFNRLFKELYDCTPTEYRERYGNVPHQGLINEKFYKSRTYLDVDRTSALKKLFTYLKPKDVGIQNIDNRNAIEYIYINGRDRGRYFKHYWKKLITFGRAAEGLRANWRRQFRELQNEIPFEYVRFHGIFMDEMMIYNVPEKGKVEYNWSYVNELFDFFMEMNIKPFIELGFMPSDIKRSDETIFWWKGNISPPKDIKLWTDLVEEFIKHCINRYGIKEVETWYFEVWNEPESEYFFWAGSKEEYFNFYKETALTIKSVSKTLKVGGPAITYSTVLNSHWLEEFLIFCNKNKTPFDFLSMHIYPEYIPKDEMEKAIYQYNKGVSLTEVTSNIRKAYHGKNHVLNTIAIINEKVETILSNKPEIHITEWNASALFGNLIHDTCYVATYIIKNVLQSIDKVDSLGYWTFTDIFEEHKLGISHFHGGFGLISKDGLKKPSYYAYYLLSKLATEIIGQGEDYIITREDDNIQILAYNYAYFDDLFSSGDISLLTERERYLIYEDKPIKEIEINISEIFGDYKIIRYGLNREKGSVFDEWIKMGAPENMTKEEIKYLEGKSKPEITIKYLNLDGIYTNRLYIPLHGVELIVLEKKI